MPIPAPIRGWASALIRGRGATRPRARDLVRTRGRDRTPGPGPGRIRGWASGWAHGQGQERAHSPPTSPALEPISDGMDRRTRRPVPAPAPSSARGHGPARSLARLIHGRAPVAVRTPTRALRAPAHPGRQRAGTPARRPRPVPRVPGRPTPGLARAAPGPAVPGPGAPERVALARAARPAGARRAGAREAGAQAASLGGTAMRAVSHTRTERPPGAGLRATTSRVRASRGRPAGRAGSCQAAMRKPVAAGRPARPAQVRRRQPLAGMAQVPAGGFPAGGGAWACHGSGCGRARPDWPWAWWWSRQELCCWVAVARRTRSPHPTGSARTCASLSLSSR